MLTDRFIKKLSFAHRGLVASCVIAAALSIIAMARSQVIAKDGVNFIGLAQRLEDHPAQTMRETDQHPGYPALILGMRKILSILGSDSSLREWTLAAQGVSLIAGIGCVVLVWKITRTLFDSPLPEIAALLAACLPVFRQNGADALSDTPHLAFYLLSIYCGCQGLERRSFRYFALCGLASGVAYWIRPEGLVAAACAGFAIVFCTAWLRVLSPRQGICAALCVSVAALVVCAPYVVIKGKLTNKKSPFSEIPTSGYVPHSSPTAVAAANEVDPANDLAGVRMENKPHHGSADDTARSNTRPGRLRLALWEFGKEFTQGMYYFLLVPLAVGCFAPGRLRSRTLPTVIVTTAILVQAGLLIALHFSVGYLSHRHVMPDLALCMPILAAGTWFIACDVIVPIARHWLAVRLKRRIALGLTMLAFMVALLPTATRPIHSSEHVVGSAAQWLAGHSDPGSRVLATSNLVGFYSGRTTQVLGVEVDELANALQLNSAERKWDFLVLEVDANVFHPSATSPLTRDYERVLDLAGKSPSRRVQVFRPIQRVASTSIDTGIRRR